MQQKGRSIGESDDVNGTSWNDEVGTISRQVVMKLVLELVAQAKSY
jgi:hypothetical protein